MRSFVNACNLSNNPSARVAICMCLDTSFSMNRLFGKNIRSTGRTIFRDGRQWNIATGGSPIIDELRNGVSSFFQAIQNDAQASLSADISIVTFDDTARTIMDFNGSQYSKECLKKLTPRGNGTAMGAGVNLALDLLDKRKKEYKQAGVDYYQPWLVIMSDGSPNGSKQELNRAKQRTQTLLQKKGIVTIPVGIGAEADMGALNNFAAPGLRARRLKDANFSAFFQWLSASISMVSQSAPGLLFNLDSVDVCSWSDLR